MFKNVRFTYSVVSFNTALILNSMCHPWCSNWMKKKKRVLSPRRQRQVQVMVKVSGLTCRSVGLVKGENCTRVWRADRGSKLGGGVKWKCSLLELISRESDCSQSARAFQLTADITWETAAAKPPALWQHPFYRCHCNIYRSPAFFMYALVFRG